MGLVPKIRSIIKRPVDIPGQIRNRKTGTGGSKNTRSYRSLCRSEIFMSQIQGLRHEALTGGTDSDTQKFLLSNFSVPRIYAT